MENSGDKRGLGGEVRVSDESKVSAGESNRGGVISATERKSVQSGNLRTNNWHDVSKNRIVEKVSGNNRWESWGVMNMVGRVLGGKLYMDDEVEDVNDSKNWGQVNPIRDMNAWQDVTGKPTSENQGEVNRVADMDAWQDVTKKPTSANGINIKRTDINSDSVRLDLGCLGEGNNLNGNQDVVSREIVPGGQLRSEEINYVKDDVLRPEGCGETEEAKDIKADTLLQKGHGKQDLLINEIVPDVPMVTEEVNGVKADMLIPKECSGETEKEGEYNVSDLVWGKVRSHPWWPGQIFPPSAASDKAKKYFKKESYLVAYFGDQSFAWNEGSKLMPFPMYFSDMEKQSNADGFSQAVNCALDEAARRVELGLSCPCLAQEVRDNIKFQVLENSGIREESSIRAGGGNVSSVATFLPGDVLQFLESMAKCPQSEHDRLQFTIAKAQLQAYTRWKGYHQLPVCEEYTGLLEDDTQFNVMGVGNDSMEVMEELLPCPVSDAANDGSSKKRKSMAQNGSTHKRKQLLGDEQRPKIKEKFMSVLLSAGSSSLQNNDKKPVKRTSRKVVSSAKSHEMVSSTSSNSKSKKRKTLLSTGATTSEIDANLASDGAGKSQIVEIIPDEIPTPDMVLSKLILAAQKPMQGQDAMIPVVDWLRKFRNSISLENFTLADPKVDLEKHKREQPSQTADSSVFGGTEDSYWTDRIIQNYSQDQAMSESQKPYDRDAKPEADFAVVPKLDDDKESNNVVDLDTGNRSAPTNEVSEEYRPTALILNFRNLDSIPSVENLNEIFSRFGTLYESETKILSKSKRVKVIFRRPKDAETAFSSAGKYSIFGPSLVSYRLHYTPKPRKSQKTSKKKKEGKQNKEGTSQKVDAV
ncbi:Tudor/PWWP/MBT superfamily protein [Perilla frutescens var. hirtella]|nr:Tudor/PWWP/MBT superfamily protein [Perilla frutescens var. hirtella]